MGVVATMTLTTSDQASAASPQPLAAPTAPPGQVPHERSEAAATQRPATQRPAPLPPSLWDDPRIEEALANRDIAAIFKFLQTLGISQRTIARYTAQSQSEISEVLAGRTVARYDVLVRIAIGLGIPRGRLGLAYDDPQHHRDFTQQGRPIPRAVTPTTTAEPVVTTQVDRFELCQFAKATARTPRPATPAKRPTATDKMIAAISEKQAPIVRTHLSATHTPGVPLIRTVAMWTGLQIRAIREAKRMSAGTFTTTGACAGSCSNYGRHVMAFDLGLQDVREVQFPGQQNRRPVVYRRSGRRSLAAWWRRPRTLNNDHVGRRRRSGQFPMHGGTRRGVDPCLNQRSGCRPGLGVTTATAAPGVPAAPAGAAWRRACHRRRFSPYKVCWWSRL